MICLQRRTFLIGTLVGATLLPSAAPTAAVQDATPPSGTAPQNGWAATGGNAARTGAVAEPGPSSTPAELWRFPLDLGAAPAPGGPLVADGTVYLATWQASGLVALDVGTGAERWRAEVGLVIGSLYGELSAAVEGGVLYVVGTEGAGASSDSAPPAAVYALDAATGQERWRYSFGAELHATTPIVVGELLVFTTESFDENAVHALDTATGQERWTATLSPALGFLTAVAAGEGALYLAAIGLDGSEGGAVLSLDPVTGTERWRVDFAGWSHGMPTVADGNVYVLLGGDDSGSVSLHALDPATGAERWTFDRDDSPATPATIERTISIERVVTAGDRVYVGVQEDAQTDAGFIFTNAVVALDATTGSEQWRVVDVAFPVMAADVLYVNTVVTQMDQSAEPAVVALDAVTGAEVWRYPGEIVIVLAAADGLVFVLAYDGLIALGSAP